MAGCSYNCTDLPDHEQVICGAYSKGGVSALAVLECDHVITDFTDPVQWADAIANNKATIIQGIKGQIPAPSPIKNPNPVGCGAETVLDGYDRTVTWMDANMSQSNIDFYNALNLRSAYLVVYNCTDDDSDPGEITVIETSVNFEVHRILPESNKEKQMFNGTGEFTKFDESPIYSAPSGIFS